MRTFPDYIQFYPTLRCNKSCGFCFNKNMPSMPDMPLERFRKMLRTLRGIGVKSIDIIGGEPTLHPDIEIMISDAEEAGFLVNISSNGTDLSALERIIRNNERTTVGISVNERYELESLKSFIVRCRPVVKTVFRKDLDLVFVEDIMALQPKRFFLLFHDAVHEADLGRSMAFDRYLFSVRERFGNNTVSTVFCSGFLPEIETHPDLARVRCPAGTAKLGVMPDGSVYPCNLFFGIESFRLGNVLSDPFERIWSHPSLAFFRMFTGNACPRTSCGLHAHCHGGCPAHSLIHNKDLSAPDPRCVKN